MRHPSTALNEFKKPFVILVALLTLGEVLFFYPTAPTYAAPKATITVTTTSESSAAGCTLRDAILAANTDTVKNNCPTGSGTDTIGFGALSGTIVLTGSLPAIAQDLTIDGGGAITVSGSNLYQIVSVNSGVNLNLIGLRFQSGNSGTSGGAIYNQGNLAITNTAFISNSSGNYGGAIENANDSGLRIVNSTFSNNTSTHGGGAIDTNATAANLSILNSTFSNNSASIDNGGAIYVFWMPTIIGNSSFVNNTAGGLGEGGGVRIEGTITTVITNSAFFANTAESGGAVSNSGGTVLITDTTFSSNKANNNGGGLQVAGGTSTLNNVTIARNIADDNYPTDSVGNGGGIFFGSGTLNIRNSIIAGNIDKSGEAPDLDCASVGSPTSLGYNLLGKNVGCLAFSSTTGDQVGTGATPKDPKLGPLGYYGGSTLVHSLLTGSLALNNGNPAAPGSGGNACASSDQRGVGRPISGTCDMGAYEGVGYGLFFPLILR